MADLPVTTLTKVCTERFYEVADGVEPVTSAAWSSRRTRIIPRKLKLRLGINGKVCAAVITGPAARVDGTIGTHEHTAVWGCWPDERALVPDWIDETIRRDGLVWADRYDAA